MNMLPFGSLPVYKPRRFLPAELQLGDWTHIEPCFDRLEARAAECRTPAELENWLLDWSELAAALDEEGARRYIAMTCHTEEPEAEKAYLHFVENIEPNVKPRQSRLERIYVQHPLRRQLDPQRYCVFDRDTANRVELFRPENVPLETEEAKLGQQYQKLSGSLTVQFHGEEKTLVQMARHLEEPDRELRQQSWELVVTRRLQEADKFDALFDQLCTLRQQIARNTGFENYRDYAFRKLGRFDYGPQECFAFHEAVETEVMPLLRRLQAERRRHLGLASLRPWDLSVDVFNRPPLRPFAKTEELLERSQAVMDQLDPELAAGFRRMRQLHLLDLDNRKGKAPGGYQSTLAEARVPFIFMNAVGIQRDVETIFHEGGHAFHALASQGEDLYTYRNPPIEFCEVASMSMELLGNGFLEHFYSAPDSNRARRMHLEGVLNVLPWIATVDAFQHWIYTHPGHSRAERRQVWVALMERFAGDVDWTGYQSGHANTWHRQLHLFLHPFYYIEYGIAQLGALQVWANSKRDQARALHQYKQALRLGASKPLPELFAAAGCRFEFGRDTMKPLMNMLHHELLLLEPART